MPAARQVGITQLQIEAIENWQGASCFSEVERLVLKFTDEVNAAVKAGREEPRFRATAGIERPLTGGDGTEVPPASF